MTTATANRTKNTREGLRPASTTDGRTALPLKTLGQTIFGEPAELASLIAFCDAQLSYWSSEPVHGYFKEIKKRLQLSIADQGRNDLKENHFCACGCGTQLTGNAKMRFVNSAHRVKYFRLNQRTGQRSG